MDSSTSSVAIASGPPPHGVDDRYWQITRPAEVERLRRAFKQMNRGMVWLWRLGLGRFANIWPSVFGRILVVEHLGRTTGNRYLTPLNYASVGDDHYCVAAFGEHTDWYRNVMLRPEVAVWLPDGRWLAKPVDAETDARRIALVRQVLIDSGFAAPLFGLHPKTMSDGELKKAAADYRLVLFRPIMRQPAPGGPNDFAWVWLALSLAILLRASKRRASRP